ncbi:hypothetical protein K2P97_10810 [bacterium]|nr:hypothetical protein [bacterium]
MYNIASKLKKHRLYKDFLEVKNILARHQFVCWIAGGAVRDFYLDREVNEFDLVTDATTEILKELFPKAILVGESFGVIKIPAGESDFFDLATFRQESDYADGRRPSLVTASTPYKDSERRDFKLNAMFWDDERGVVVDYRNGLSDITLQTISCVGDANLRFKEDHLRILRLIRFSAQLGFSIETETYDAALRSVEKISLISGERVWSELKKINSAGAWEFIFKESLFKELLGQILKADTLSFEHLQNVRFSMVKDVSWLPFLIIYLLKESVDFTDVLKKNLKLSNQELQKYVTLKYLLKEGLKKPLADLAYDIENSVVNLEALNFLVEAGVVDGSLKFSVENKLKHHPIPLIKAQDVLGVIPNHVISIELKNIRISQFNEVYKTKADVLDYLKKKYADMGEKP